MEVRERGPFRANRRFPPIAFTLDWTPPEIRLTRPDGMPEGVVPWVEVIDDNPDTLEVLVDGRPFDRTEPLPAGAHLLEARATDRAGNTAYVAETVVTAESCQLSSYVVYVQPQTTLSAAHYFPWHRGSAACPATSFWCNCVWGPKPGNPEPALGFYSSTDPGVTGAQLDEMAAYGVDVVSVEWNGQPFETDNLLNVVVPAITGRNLKWVLLYDLAIRFKSDINFDQAADQALIQADFTEFVSSASYFQHPQYLKFSNRPVIYMYVTRAIQGSAANVEATFDALHQAAVDAGFNGLYIVADHLYWGSPDYAALARIGARAATAFAPVDSSQGVSQNATTRPVRTWADKIRNLYSGALGPMETNGLFDLTPGVFVQYDDTGLDSPACISRPDTMAFHLLDGTDWSYMLQRAGLDRRYIAENQTVLRRSPRRPGATTPRSSGPTATTSGRKARVSSG